MFGIGLHPLFHQPPPRKSSATMSTTESDGMDVNPMRDGSGTRTPVIRNITFWRDGFTMGDGPLRRYDDPANGKLLAAIHAGHAPPDLLDAPIGQRVDVQVTSCIKNDYRPPFTETGIKLGGDPSLVLRLNFVLLTLEKASARTSASASTSAQTTSNAAAPVALDPSQPTTNVQVRLPDGQRARLDLRNPAYSLSAAYPTRLLEDEGASIQREGFEGSAVMVQWI
ncbi:SEP domain-containing protein [Mycena filopes]|nr:SEP domain-containing protein [Mycena filopes]